MIYSRAAVVLIACLTLSGSGMGQISKQGNAYLFRIKFAKGQSSRYVLTSRLALPPGPPGGANAQLSGQSITLPIAQRVLSLTKDVASIQITSGPLRIGKEPLGQAQQATVKINTVGKVVDGTSISPTFTVFPAKAIPIGGTWTSRVPLGPAGAMSGSGTATVTYKLVGLKTLEGKQVAELSMVLSGTGPNPFAGKGRAFITVADGAIRTVEFNVTTKSDQSPVNITVSVAKVQ